MIFLLLFLTLVVLLLLIAFYFVLLSVFFGAPFVPTHRPQVSIMMDIAQVGPADTMIDLGSGDGRLVIAAGKRGARSIGFELNPFLVWWSRWRARRANVHERVQFFQGDYWRRDLSHASVVTLFLITDMMGKMEKKLQRELKPGTRVVSYGFRFPTWPLTEKRGAVFLYVR